jgi:hypothetical protein
VIDGEWLVTESFADEVHQLSCDSEGVFNIIQDMSSDPGETRPSATFNGSLTNDNDCMSVDGPFTYVGQGALAQGFITRQPFTVRFDADVNEANCSYVGLIRGEDDLAMEIEGTLECTLEQAGVLFEFEGAWSAIRL